MSKPRGPHRTAAAVVLAALVLAACGGGQSATGPAGADPAGTDPAGTTGTSPGEQPEPTGETITVTDSAGRTVEIALPVERIAILDSGTADVLRALGALDRLVGSHQAVADDPFFAEIADVTPVATHSEISFEALAEVQPDLVISSVRAHGVVTDNEVLSGLDIVDLKLSLRRPELMKEEVALLGRILQAEERADELIDFYEHWEAFVADRVGDLADDERRRVFVEYHSGDYATGGPGSRFYEQVVLAGGINLSADIDGEVQVDAEWVVQQDPDVFLREMSATILGYHVTSTAQAEQLHDEIVSRPVIDATTAVRNGDVYLLPTNIYSRPAYVIGVLYLAKWLYPDRFEDLDPEAVHREYIETFHPGITYQGIWAYPFER